MRGPLLPGEPAAPLAVWDGLALRDGALWVRFGTPGQLLEVIGYLPEGHELRQRLVAVADMLAR